MEVRSFSYDRYHGKNNIGSTRLRVTQLQKYWPEYKDYKYGENPDCIIFQKVYVQQDWDFIEKWPGIKILDICDPDWLEQQHVKQTLDAVDGATCPTESMANFLRQMTDKPIKVIPDRHDIENIPPLKTHTGDLSHVVWFGYRQNAELLKSVVPALERLDIELTVISNDEPYAFEWGTPNWKSKYHFMKFDEETIIDDLREFDACILPQGNRPQDRFKSDNKTTLAWLAGLPVIKDDEDLAKMRPAEARDKEAKKCHNIAISKYDVRLSVTETKEFINGLKSIKSK